MKRYVFVDDERMPANVNWVRLPNPSSEGTEWVILRSFDEAVLYIDKCGIPDFISFDHDLSLRHYGGDYTDEKTGYDLCKYIIEHDMNHNSIPDNFDYSVHSKNPIGSSNISCLLNNYLFKKYHK